MSYHIDNFVSVKMSHMLLLGHEVQSIFYFFCPELSYLSIEPKIYTLGENHGSCQKNKAKNGCNDIVFDGKIRQLRFFHFWCSKNDFWNNLTITKISAKIRGRKKKLELNRFWFFFEISRNSPKFPEFSRNFRFFSKFPFYIDL